MDGHRTHGWHNPNCSALSVLLCAVVRLAYTFVMQFGKCRGTVTTAILIVCIASSGNASYIFQFDTNRTSSYTAIRLCTSHHCKLQYFLNSLSSILPLYTCPPFRRKASCFLCLGIVQFLRNGLHYSNTLHDSSSGLAVPHCMFVPLYRNRDLGGD